LPANTAADTVTVSLTLAFNTGTSVPGGQIPWGTINTAVKSSGKYVLLDLSASTAAHDTTPNTIEGEVSTSASDNYINIIQNNTYIKGIILPNTLTIIGYYAFAICTSLTSVTIPEGVTSIGEGAFVDCTGLTSVIIPDSVTSIGDDAFADCTGLTSVTIPGSVKSIGDYAFYNCSGLTTVSFGTGSNITKEWNNNAFSTSNFISPSTSSSTGTSLWNAYNTGGPGTYTLTDGTWSKQTP
jgi:hypothetical protein